MPIPPIDRPLGATLDALEVEEQVGRRVKPRKPNDGREQIPLADVDVARLTKTKHDHGPDRNQAEGNKENGTGVVGELEPLNRTAITGKDAVDS